MKRALVLLLALAAPLAGCDDTSDPVRPAAPTHDLLFEGVLDSVPELLILDAETGAPRRLLASGTIARDPAPSPDGARIAFVVADDLEGTGDIFVINRDGTGLRQLTFDPELDDQPAWSPDGRRLAFSSFRTQYLGDIWVIDEDGSNELNLTPDALPAVTNERRPAWSPDGARIAYASDAGGNIDLWTMNADGTDKRRLTNSTDLDTEPAWSPDGATIAFRRSADPTGADICRVPAAGGDVVTLALPGEQRLPAWTPAGDRLVFVGQATFAARPDLYSMRADGTGLLPLVGEAVPGGSLNPAFLRRP